MADAAQADTGGRRRSWRMVVLVGCLLVGLPVAVIVDLRRVTESMLRQQAEGVDRVITAIRAYYASDVVGRILDDRDATTKVIHNYQAVPGAIPIPATLSLELGRVMAERQGNIEYRFVSDHPFANRAPHRLDDFERGALDALRRDPKQELTEMRWSGLDGRLRIITPIVMGATCIECHNTHPESTKRDWKIGDVRGIQETAISQTIGLTLSNMGVLLLYFVFMAAVGTFFILTQARQATAILLANGKLARANDFLAAISRSLSRYLAPQVFQSIFSGAKDVSVQTERKKLTIFFSDIKDFTATTERMQPEELTRLLNEYLTEMSAIAIRHGGTIDKFIGDALLVFFGDPETKGEVEDARACLRMAIDMQRRLAALNVEWRRRGVEHPFQARMGINTGFCNVGNFGSADRIDYTIIGAETNLAARLQSIAAPGGICVSYETFALVREIASGRPLAPITMKGIAREVVPYAIDGLLDASGQTAPVFAESGAGVALYLDLALIERERAAVVATQLRAALAALEAPGAVGPAVLADK